MTHIIVVANGGFRHPKRLAAVLSSADLIIAADGGANWLATHHLQPQVLIGDLDSITPNLETALESAGCQIIRHPAHKDETDTELALIHAAQRKPDRITLIGALGGRIDHELANVMLLALPALRGIDTMIYDGTSWMTLLHNAALQIGGVTGDTVSLLPLGGDCLGITTQGLAYPLEDESLRFGLARGVSNVMARENAQVSLRSGYLLVVYTAAAPQTQPTLETV